MRGGVFLKNKVEQLRKERGLNQDDFAKMLRVSRQTISSIETGKYNPSLELAFAISDFFIILKKHLLCRWNIQTQLSLIRNEI